MDGDHQVRPPGRNHSRATTSCRAKRAARNEHFFCHRRNDGKHWHNGPYITGVLNGVYMPCNNHNGAPAATTVEQPE